MFKVDIEAKYLYLIYKWEITVAFTYITKNGRIITVPIKFRWDGASIPRFAWSLIGSPFVGRYVRGSLIHDFLCWLADKAKSKKEFKRLRAYADKIFLEIMREDGVSRIKSRTMWLAVRGQGKWRGLVWRKKDENTSNYSWD